MPQPHRGDRVPTNVRLPRPMRVAAEAIAERDGIAVGDAVMKVFGEALGFPIPHYSLPESERQNAQRERENAQRGRDTAQQRLEMPLGKAS